MYDNQDVRVGCFGVVTTKYEEDKIQYVEVKPSIAEVYFLVYFRNLVMSPQKLILL